MVPGKPRVSVCVGQASHRPCTSWVAFGGGFGHCHNSGVFTLLQHCASPRGAPPSPHSRAVQWVQLSRAQAHPCCSAGHPGMTHLGLGSLHHSMRWNLGAGAFPSVAQPHAAVAGAGVLASPRHLALLPAATWAQGARVGLCSSPPWFHHMRERLPLPGTGTGLAGGNKCQCQRDAASRDLAVLAHRVLPRATLGTLSTAAGRG